MAEPGTNEWLSEAIISFLKGELHVILLRIPPSALLTSNIRPSVHLVQGHVTLCLS